ncbi:pilin protein [Selenomonas bovis]|uniref:pilin protein n=1 Tax=Selenomonas bovis TaxID=416586 RepID=UPI003AB93A19
MEGRYLYLRCLLLQQKAQGMVEYALIVAFAVGILIVISVTNPQLQQSITNVFARAAQEVDNLASGT